jgi:hypothetical protein
MISEEQKRLGRALPLNSLFILNYLKNALKLNLQVGQIPVVVTEKLEENVPALAG